MKPNRKCQRCSLHESAKNVCLWGEGDPHARIMFVGEAPGHGEDLADRPFVGQAGKLLDHVLHKVGLKREEVFITNVLRCRPPNNKLPSGKKVDELVKACWPYITKEIEDVCPRVIVLLGGTALHAFTGKRFIARHEGQVVGTNMVAAFHPAYVLRAPSKEASLARAIGFAMKKAGYKRKAKGLEAGLYEYDVRGV